MLPPTIEPNQIKMNKDTFKLDGTIGMNSIKHMEYKTIEAIKSKAYQFKNGIVPIGNFLIFFLEITKLFLLGLTMWEALGPLNFVIMLK